MDEHTAKTPINSGTRNMKLVYDAPSFSLGLTQEDLVTVVSNPLQLRKFGISKEIRSKFCIDEVKMMEILKRKELKKTPSPKEQKTKKQLEKKRKSKEIEDKVEKSYDESEEESEEEVMRDEIFLVRKLSRFVPHMCSYSDNDIYGSICAILNKEQFKNFCENNIFGFFMKKKQCVVQAQLYRCVVTLEVKGSSSSGIMISVSGTSLSFTPMEFAIITGLNYVSNRSLNNRLKAGGKFYLIQGMPLAIQVWLYECCSNVPPKIALKVENRIPRLLNGKTIAPRPRYEFLMNVMFKDNGKVVFKNIEPTEMKMAKLEIPKKDVTENERSVDSDDDFQDPPPKKINKRSKKKQKVDSSTPVVKKPAGKKQVNIDDAHTQTRTPPHRAAKDAVMKTPVFKSIPTRQAFSSKTKEGKKIAKVIFPQVQSKADSHVEEVASSKRESHVDKEKFISKKVFDAFHEEVRQEFKGVREEFTRIRQLVKKKFKKMVKAIEHSKQQHEDTEVEAQQMDYASVETSPQQFSPIVDQNLDENQDGTKKNKENVGSSSKADMHGEVDVGTEEQIMTTPKTEDLTIDEKRDESIIVHPSVNREIQTPIAKLRIKRPFKFKESPYTMKFGSAAESSEGHIRIFPQKHPFVYHPIDGIVDTKIVNKFRDWISEDLLKVHAKRKGNADHYKRGKSTIPMMHFGIETVEDKNWFYTMGFPDQSWTDSHIDVCFYYLRKKSKNDPNRSYKFSTIYCNFMNIISSLHDVYSADAENLMVGGHVAHINEYINGFCMHAAVPWHTVEDIYIPVNIKEKHHWVLAILSFSERCIFIYDSYESSGHYSAVLDIIEKLGAIIPLCLEHCDFYVKKGIHVENHPRYKDKDSSNMFDVLFQENLPQQPSGSLDCGVYMVTYAECLSYGHKILAIEFDLNALRTRYAVILWDYGTRKQELNAHSDVEEPLRHPRQSRITSVTEVFDV
ncbi:hypothetical protein FXO38_34967 [Capsicum annuum]|nr:hypothetical protein FXO38_34967 [Capsicum annuum]